MDNKFFVIGIIFELSLLFLVLIKIRNRKKISNIQPPLPKEIIKKIKFK